MATKKEVQTTKENLPVAFDYGDDVGSGFENQSQDHVSIPLLKVLQALSPEVKPPAKGGVEGAKAGNFYIPVTEQLFEGEEGIEIIPAYVEHAFIEFVPRDKGGGFVAKHDPESELVARAKSNSTKYGKYKNGENELIETFSLFAVLPEGQIVVVPFSSTKIKVYKNWNTKLRMFTLNNGGKKINPPIFAHRVKLKTDYIDSDKGDYYNISLKPAVGNSLLESLLDPKDERYVLAKSVKDMVKEDKIKAEYHQPTEDEIRQDNKTPTSVSEDGEEIPF